MLRLVTGWRWIVSHSPATLQSEEASSTYHWNLSLEELEKLVWK
jgi:hypothetical protein